MLLVACFSGCCCCYNCPNFACFSSSSRVSQQKINQVIFLKLWKMPYRNADIAKHKKCYSLYTKMPNKVSLSSSILSQIGYEPRYFFVPFCTFLYLFVPFYTFLYLFIPFCTFLYLVVPFLYNFVPFFTFSPFSFLFVPFENFQNLQKIIVAHFVFNVIKWDLFFRIFTHCVGSSRSSS